MKNEKIQKPTIQLIFWHRINFTINLDTAWSLWDDEIISTFTVNTFQNYKNPI